MFKLIDDQIMNSAPFERARVADEMYVKYGVSRQITNDWLDAYMQGISPSFHNWSSAWNSFFALCIFHEFKHLAKGA